MDQLVIGCVRRVVLVCGKFLLRILRWLSISYWIPAPRPDPPDALNSSKWGTHRYIKIHDIKLHYVEKGSSSKPLMLFLHGLPDFWYSWRYQMHEFSQDYWTVALDLPGFGRSEPPIYSITYKVNNLARIVCSLINALGKSDCILIGNGAGAILGWHLVNQFPEKVSKYVMLGAPSEAVLQQLYDRGAIPLGTLLKAGFLSCRADILKYLARADDYSLFDDLLGANSKPQDLEAYKYTFAQRTALERALLAFRENFVDFFLEQYEFRVRKSSNTPGLFLFGEKFCSIDPEEYVPLLVHMYRPLETRFIPRVGHFMHQDNPKMVSKIISEFLREHTNRPKRSIVDAPARQILVKDVCDNCYGKEHSKPGVAHHDECANNCDGQEHRHIFTKVKVPISS
ncbi:epoxide hydrolase 4-like [Anopheles maculipalpis]|uniref:epoxide hydrolase 4-like n=1 Tax=Anopheles maculipalpis TaxID=1496333 RepID=UPI002159359A|nr:epoxide hydrolase 4-like [Anopheles maculipalpis]